MRIHRSTLAAPLLATLLSAHLLACSRGASRDGTSVDLTPADPGSPGTTPTPPPPSGPQFYVSTTGDDAAPGTIDAPWRTIQKALESATPGSTVNIRGGTYSELLVARVSGTEGNPITFQPYGFAGSRSCGGHTGNACPGEPVVLDYSAFGTLTSPTPALLVSGRAYLVFQGLVLQNYTVDGPMHVGIQIDGWSHDISFRWLRVESFRNVHAAGMDGTTMLAVARAGWGSTGADNVTFLDCQFYNSKTNMAEVLSWDLGSGGGAAERNHVRDCDGIAIHAYRGAHDFVFRDNLVEWAGVNRDGSLPYPGNGDTGIGLYNDGGHDALIERNVGRSSGYALESLAEDANSGGGAQPPVYNVVVRDNVFVGNHYGMTIGTWYSATDGSTVHDHSVYNNTIYGGNVGFYVRPFDPATVRIRNNVVAANGTAFANPLGWNVGTAFDYNLYWGGGTGPDVHAVNADPMFADAAAGDFSLLPGSPARDAGDPSTTAANAGDVDLLGAPRFVGPIDLGAIEGT